VTARSILHIDLDAFFVSVELLDRPELRGTPVVVGGTGQRGVVAAASYEARSYGVHSAMPTVTARRLCPQATFLPGRHSRYAEVSSRLMAIFRDVTPLVEPLSLDEAFLDVTGSLRRLGPAPSIAAALRDRVAKEEGLACSVGVGPSKFIAKLATEHAKPGASPTGPVPGRGVFVVVPDEVSAFLGPLPVGALWGVGPATRERLARLGVSTVGDLARLPVDALRASVGDAVGRHLHALANGRDDRPVTPDLAPKSVSHEETFAVDIRSFDEVQRELVRMADSVAARLRASNLRGRTVGLKVRYSEGFRTISRSSTLHEATDDGLVILAEARRLLGDLDLSPGVRLVGVGVTKLDAGEARQLSFDGLDQPSDASDRRPTERTEANRAVDEIRRRFGRDAIGPGRLANDDGVGTFEPGGRQWGPLDGEDQGT
jgi:DNA polymerase-4